MEVIILLVANLLPMIEITQLKIWVNHFLKTQTNMLGKVSMKLLSKQQLIFVNKIPQNLRVNLRNLRLFQKVRKV